MKAKDIMAKEIITVKQDATIREIAKVLIDNKVSGVPVVDNNGGLVGIVTEGDLLFKETNPRLPEAVNILGAILYYDGVERYNEDFKKLIAGQAGEIMTDKVVVISEDTEIAEIAKLMIKHNIKRLPVVKEDKIIGIVSRADIIKTFLT
ncbi:MAG TPA: CBS domain-containing protein [Methylomusa anaerophila]|uniref:Hypoxic response protein 1 n=1 Tax=Methylomusa anaerophila TaxID=1930071 RepID=A0A348AJB2_9FIRM|nr:CBS domain-containing protein [Methylomusa anaerophila]BBB91160.1 hypoxic response protein 1 [Methylomusa anaerophila]HML89038.1 CBS domain-containing protein [Methylomusa anaerophila]